MEEEDYNSDKNDQEEDTQEHVSVTEKIQDQAQVEQNLDKMFPLQQDEEFSPIQEEQKQNIDIQSSQYKLEAIEESEVSMQSDPLTEYKQKVYISKQQQQRFEPVNDNPYIQQEIQPQQENASYEVQPGDSLLKIAYLHNISKVSIINLNNLPSDSVTPGQKLKLPISSKPINSVPDVKKDLNKNTNTRNYNIDEDFTENNIYHESNVPLVKADLKNFMSGFETKIGVKDEIKNPSPPRERAYSNSYGMFSKLYDTFNFMTGSTPKEQPQMPQLDLNVPSEQKQDPILQKDDRQFNNFDVYTYIEKNEDHNMQVSATDYIIKVKVYYLIKYDQVYGTLTVNKNQVSFYPDLDAPENDHLTCFENPHLTQHRKVSDYICLIDYNDIIECNVMPLINEQACLSENEYIREAYKYDMFLQIMLTSVNGITLNRQFQEQIEESGAKIDDENQNAILKRNQMPIANIYFKCSHSDESQESNGYQPTKLTNQYQQRIIEEVKEQINNAKKLYIQSKESDCTATFISYYDSIIEKKHKNHLSECKMNPSIKTMVQTQLFTLQTINSEIEAEENEKGKHREEAKETENWISNYSFKSKQSSLLQYMPTKSHKSTILSDLQISNLIAELPGYNQTSSWERLFNMDIHGCSFITFFQKVKDYENTVLIIEDQNGYKFGGFCVDPWRCSYSFFGNGENLLFTFKDKEDPIIYSWTGEGEQHMYANNKSIGLGGSSTKGRFALFIENDLYRGSSTNTESYDNQCLAFSNDFLILHLEVWALID